MTRTKLLWPWLQNMQWQNNHTDVTTESSEIHWKSYSPSRLLAWWRPVSAQAATYCLRQRAILGRPLARRAAGRWCTARGAIVSSSFPCSFLHPPDHCNAKVVGIALKIPPTDNKSPSPLEAIAQRNPAIQPKCFHKKNSEWRPVGSLFPSGTRRPNWRKIAAVTFWNQIPRDAPRNNAPIKAKKLRNNHPRWGIWGASTAKNRMRSRIAPKSKKSANAARKIRPNSRPLPPAP